MIQEQVMTFAQARRDCPAYRNGWEDGRFGPRGTFAENGNLAPYVDHDRLAYYRGHRDGRRVRDMLDADTKSA
jgi:hypothetical protein